MENLAENIEQQIKLETNKFGKKYDYVVFGASGFTGQYVVEELARTTSTAEKTRTWAIAGRSEGKLREVLRVASENTGLKLSEIPIVIVDVSNPESLVAMAKDAKIILNCVGPYRFFGEPVVKAAIEGKAHHVDISGEPSYLEGMALKYHDAAKKAGIFIVGTCGWDSIPSEMGIQYTRENFDGALNAVETVVEVDGGSKGLKIHFGTFQSMIYGFSNRGELKSVRKLLMDKPVPRSSHKLKPRGVLFFHEGANGWCLPFMGSDKPVAQRTQYYNYHERDMKPIQVQTYIKFPNMFMALATLVWGIFFGIMASFDFGRQLLEKYPHIFSFGYFSHEGPSREHLKETTFKTQFFGRGWLGKKDLKAEEDPAEPPTGTITCQVTGPDPGYVATSACLVASAKTILEEMHSLPSGGGVYTPGAAFAKTSKLIDTLQNRGIKFSKIA